MLVKFGERVVHSNILCSSGRRNSKLDQNKQVAKIVLNLRARFANCEKESYPETSSILLLVYRTRSRPKIYPLPTTRQNDT